MSADVWLRRDIANALTAADQAMRETMTATAAEGAAYARGYRAALSVVALFFGIAPGQVLAEPTRAALADRAD